MTGGFVPFVDGKSIKIGGATIESDADCVSIYDSIDFTRDQVGLTLARQLKTLVDAVVAALEAEPALPAVLPVKAAGTTKNPFS